MSDLKFLAFSIIGLSLGVQYVAAFIGMSNNAEVADRISKLVLITSTFIELIALIMLIVVYITK